MVAGLLFVVITSSLDTAIALSNVIAGSTGAADSKFPSGRTVVAGLLFVVITSSLDTAIALSNVIAGSAGAIDSQFSETVFG